LYAVHNPMQAPRALVEKYQQKQRQLGIQPDQLFRKNEPWMAFEAGWKQRTTQSNPVYAAMIENMDYNVGRILDQLAASGLGDLFVAVEIVSEKEATTYARVFDRHGSGPARSLMCGNSMLSDILPALEAGAWAAHVPYPMTWAHEHAEAPLGHPRFAELATIGDLPAWVAGLG
jgi:FMN phosphatase YigB (HAD superfamily)